MNNNSCTAVVRVVWLCKSVALWFYTVYLLCLSGSVESVRGELGAGLGHTSQARGATACILFAAFRGGEHGPACQPGGRARRQRRRRRRRRGGGSGLFLQEMGEGMAAGGAAATAAHRANVPPPPPREQAAAVADRASMPPPPPPPVGGEQHRGRHQNAGGEGAKAWIRLAPALYPG